MTVSLLWKGPGAGISDIPAAIPFQFPGGEQHLKDVKTDVPDGTTWIADVRGASAEDLVTAAMLADIAHRRGEPFVLWLPYLPAARADRGEPLGVAVYADLVNAMEPEQAIAIDPHSTISLGWYANLTPLDPLSLVERAIQTSGKIYDGVIAPDKGAGDRAYMVAEALGMDFYQADKKRNFDTGAIEGIDVPDLAKSGKYLVVDDICDGGATFRALAAKIGLPKDHLGLWVTHGIFSGQANLLRGSYGEIITTDSHPGCRRIDVGATIVPVFPLLAQTTKEEL